LLSEARARLLSGEDAYLKALAAELRVLVCRSSGTEGLLWRIAEELSATDEVHVHLPGNVDISHPLANGLSFSFIPILRAGEGDPRLSTIHSPLRGILKDCEALFVSGNGYTHEQLIKAVAQQLGSAHEDDGVEPHIAELGDIIFDSTPSLTHLLVSDAEYTLEVGDRVMEVASQRVGYQRKSRPRFVKEEPLLSEAQPENTSLASGTGPIPPEGTIMFLVDHPHPDWRTNASAYPFGQMARGPLSIVGQKNPDGVVELTISGIAKRPVTVRSRIPAFTGGGYENGAIHRASALARLGNHGPNLDTVRRTNRHP
jgi:hypothetical protein